MDTKRVQYSPDSLTLTNSYLPDNSHHGSELSIIDSLCEIAPLVGMLGQLARIFRTFVVWIIRALLYYSILIHTQWTQVCISSS